MQGAPHGAAVVAEEQTAGRGRRGRSWLSPPGKNLYLSLILRPQLPPARAPELTLVAAVAACEALRALGCRAGIKWPNDLQVAGKKLGGILTELHATPGQVDFVVLGIGINLNLAAADLPPELQSIATSAQIELGAPVDRAAFLADLLARLERWSERHLESGFDAIRQRWTKLSTTVGARVRVQLTGQLLEGQALGLDPSGALQIRTDAGAVQTVLAGDVETVRPAPAVD